MSASLLTDKSGHKYRLVTRSDFDGLVCSVLLTEIDLIDEIQFAHPKDIQDGRVDITANDITTNLPYSPNAHLIFDHHYSEILRNEERPSNYIINAKAPSAARVVYNYYGGSDAFPHINQEMLEAVDKSDSAHFTRDDILYPKGWVLLNYLIDPRTGLEQLNQFSLSHYDFMMLLIESCKTMPIAEILALPEVKERIDFYLDRQHRALHQIESNAKLHDHVVVLDLRQEQEILITNRFMVYAMYPESNISINVFERRQQKKTVFAVGKSILNRSSSINIGELMLHYGGGGHESAGSCQVANFKADQLLQELIEKSQEQVSLTEEQNEILNQRETAQYHQEPELITVKTQTKSKGKTFSVIDSPKSPVLILSSELAANFTATPTTGIKPLLVRLDASSAKAAKGRSIINYQWSTNYDQPIEEGIVSTVLLSEVGEYTITLRITDDQGHIAEETQIVTVVAQHQPPIAAFTISPRQGPAPLTTILDASNSVDAQGGPVMSFMWSVDGETLWGKIVTTTLTTVGEHIITLTVTDDHGLTASRQQTVYVNQYTPNWFSIGEDIKAELRFVGLKSFYHIGEFVTIDLIENLKTSNSYKKVDLWIAIETPDGQTYFMTDSPFQPFSLEPKAFKRSLENRALRYRILEFEVPPNVGGNYSFYAIYNQEGADLNQLLFTQRSNLAFAMTVLSDR